MQTIYDGRLRYRDSNESPRLINQTQRHVDIR